MSRSTKIILFSFSIIRDMAYLFDNIIMLESLLFDNM